MSGKRLSTADVTMIVRELERWRDGQLGAKLTWAILESTYGYSRQALQAHPRIKLAYSAAKEALRGGLVRSRAEYSEELAELRATAETLQASLDNYKVREKEWQKRWQRIAFHLRNKGLNVTEIESNIPGNCSPPTGKETESILLPFDKPMLSTGRT